MIFLWILSHSLVVALKPPRELHQFIFLMCSLSKEKCLLFIFHSLTLSLCISLNFRLHLSLCFSHSFRLTHWKLSSSLSMCVSLFFDSNALQAFVHVEKANPVILRLCEDSKTKLRIPNLQNIQKIKNYKHK